MLATAVADSLQPV